MRRPEDPTTSTDAQSGEGFLGRWARRKRDTLAEPRSNSGSVAERIDEHSSNESTSAEAAAIAAEVTAVDGESEVEEQAEQEIVLTDADMPPLSSLGADDDYSGFMSPGVSEGLRNKALRQLFMSAQFNVLDGLNDYDDDFTTFEALGDIVTSDMRHQIEMEAERVKREAQRLAQDGEQQPVLDDATPSQDAIGEDTNEDEVEAPQDSLVADGAESADRLTDDDELAQTPRSDVADV